MKTSRHYSLFLAAIAGGLLAGPLTALAVNAPNQQYTTGDNAMQIQVRRASALIGTDVMSSEGRKLGDITDFVFSTTPPRLEYVVVMTGGFLDIGGATRAIPAAALTFDGDTAHVAISKDAFASIPKLPANREQYLENPNTRAQLAREFGANEQENNPDSQGAGTLVAYSTMHRRDAYSTDGIRLGWIDDAWISLNRDRVPYIEIAPELNPFQLNTSGERVALALSKLQNPAASNAQYTFAVTPDQIRSAPNVAQAPGVEVVQGNYYGQSVLRVTVASANQGRSANDVGPTGFSSSERNPTASASTASAAQQIRQALDQDSTLRSANVQVIPEANRVVLTGSVPSTEIHDRLRQAASNAAGQVQIWDQITVR